MKTLYAEKNSLKCLMNCRNVKEKAIKFILQCFTLVFHVFHYFKYIREIYMKYNHSQQHKIEMKKV